MPKELQIARLIIEISDPAPGLHLLLIDALVNYAFRNKFHPVQRMKIVFQICLGGVQIYKSKTNTSNSLWPCKAMDHQWGQTGKGVKNTKFKRTCCKLALAYKLFCRNNKSNMKD